MQLERYDSGASEEFFALWRRFVPVSSQEDDEWAQKVRRALCKCFNLLPPRGLLALVQSIFRLPDFVLPCVVVFKSF